MLPPPTSSSPRPADGEAGPVTIEGAVERVVYSNPESHWSVVRLESEGGRAPATVVGRLLGVTAGERLRLTGRWERDAKYGRQFRADSYLTLRPKTLEGVRRYLGSGLVAGIGPVMAERLVRAFGLETLDVIENQPERLAEVEGIGPVRSRRIREAWAAQRGIRDVMVFLQSHEISARQAIRIVQRYGNESVSLIRENPYRLANEIFGIGFLSADRIARSLGIPSDSPERAAAGLMWVLEKATGDGHVFLPRPRLLDDASRLLELPEPTLAEALEGATLDGRLAREVSAGAGEHDRVYLPRLLEAERRLASDLARLLARPPSAVGGEIGRLLDRFEKREGLTLDPDQRLAVREALGSSALVITGGPGTGKTTLVRAIVRLLSTSGLRVELAAPTGRAAKRLGEASGADARTIHRLLEFDPHAWSFQRTRERPLEADAVIIDEASMLDLPLATSLAEAVPSRCRLVLVGDVDQLPSVGPGRVLEDLIESRRVPVVRLRRIFRQAAASRIVINAHRIRNGEMPESAAGEPTSDFFFIHRAEPEAILATLKTVVTRRIPGSFGLDPRNDIQVLTPMRRGLLGTHQLNEELQALLNPSGARVRFAPGLRVGDRVMQTRNDYELEVFNGDIGRIAGFDDDRTTVTVSYDGRRVVYERAHLDALVLAYASSVHKAQGSEYPCVVMPLHTQHRLLLQRNLLYTAVTRARRLMVLVGSRRAVALAVRHERRYERWSGLAGRLAGESPGTPWPPGP